MFASALPYVVPAIAAGLGFLGSEDTNQSNLDIAQMNNQFSAAQAAQNRAWQERMSDTSWQRGVADMRAAGINPMLAVSKGGASTPTGDSAAASPVPPMQNTIGNAINSALQAANTFADIQNKIKAANLTDAQRQTETSKQVLNYSNADNAVAQSILTQYKQAGARVESDIDNGSYGTILRYIGRLAPVINSAGSIVDLTKSLKGLNIFPRGTFNKVTGEVY